MLLSQWEATLAFGISRDDMEKEGLKTIDVREV